MCQEIADYDSETNLVKTNMVIRVDEICRVKGKKLLKDCDARKDQTPYDI